MSKKIIHIYYKEKKEEQKEKLENDIYWYDRNEKDNSKKLKKYKGGYLSFFYDYKNKKTIPQIKDIEKKKYITINNKKEILEWLRNNSGFLKINIYNTEENDRCSIITEERNLGFVEQSIYGAGFDYEIE